MPHQNKKFRRLISRHPKTTGAVILIAGATAGIIAFSGNDNPTPAGTGTTSKPAGSTSTPSDSQQPSNPKAHASYPSTPSNPASQKSVSPFITTAGMEGSEMVVRAYVSGVFENGGTCTATFSRSGSTVSSNSKGFENASYTSCQPIKIAKSKFPMTGDWSLTVSYSSRAAEGSSQSQTVKVE